MAKIVIKSNNTNMNEACPICGYTHSDAAQPLWLFTENTYYALCESCSKAQAPMLLDCVTEFNKRYWAKEIKPVVATE